MEEKFYKTEDEASTTTEDSDTDATLSDSGKSKDSLRGILKGKKKNQKKSKNRRKQVSVRNRSCCFPFVHDFILLIFPMAFPKFLRRKSFPGGTMVCFIYLSFSV